jgi:hypothetical protein
MNLRRYRPVVVIVLALTALPIGAGAAGNVNLRAAIDGVQVARSTSAHPVKLSPTRPVQLEFSVANRGNRTVSIRTVRLDGRVLGLTFFNFETAMRLEVPPGDTETRTLALDLGSLTGQASGLIPSSVSLLDQHRSVIASQGMTVDVRGSIRSVYGLFGLAVGLLTILAFLRVILRLARGKLPENRWRRGMEFLVPGIGLGLLITFTLSALRVYAAGAGSWVPSVLVCSLAAFGIGYLSPTPESSEDDEEEEEAAEEAEPAGDGPAHPTTAGAGWWRQTGSLASRSEPSK